jgi:DNA-directed RNA polymerase subunit RPC12/RpoP
MHRLPTKSTLWRYRLASCLLFFLIIGLITAVGILGYGLINNNIPIITISGYIFGGLVLLLFFNFMLTSKLRCPLCMVSPLQNRGCSKHRNVQRILGSHRIKVAKSILAEGHFSCPYCGEKTAMEVRLKNR